MRRGANILAKKAESFGDGIAIVLDNQNRGGIGNYPREKLVERCRLRYRERTVGVTRFYSALQDNGKIDRLIRCQRRDEVTTLDVIGIIRAGGNIEYYKIAQLQYPEDVALPVMDISLERVMVT